MIPVKFLCKMGDHEIEIQGCRLKVKLVDSVGVLNQLIPTYFIKDEILGLDLKRITPTNNSFDYSFHHTRNNVLLDDDTRLDSKIVTPTKSDLLYGSNYELLILCGASRCLIIHLRYMNNQVPRSVREFLQDANICFVRMPKMSSSYGWIDGVGVEADDLVARVLKKPNLKGSSMVDVAREVGVQYKDVFASSRNQSGAVQVVSKYVRVLAPEQVKLVINDAYTCYKIGSTLLTSLY